MSLQERYASLVSYFGGQVKTATALKIKQPSVHAWLVGRSKMSAITAKRAEKATDGQFKAIDLCPHLSEFEEAQ